MSENDLRASSEIAEFTSAVLFLLCHTYIPQFVVNKMFSENTLANCRSNYRVPFCCENELPFRSLFAILCLTQGVPSSFI